MNQVRLVAVRLQIEAVTDDGETLTPLGLQPLTLTAKDWWKFDMATWLADVEHQLEDENRP